MVVSTPCPELSLKIYCQAVGVSGSNVLYWDGQRDSMRLVACLQRAMAQLPCSIGALGPDGAIGVEGQNMGAASGQLPNGMYT